MDRSEILKQMADAVIETQNCVLEVILGETSAIAHLIPLEAY